MRIVIADDTGQVIGTHDIDIPALAKQVREWQLRHGDIRASWYLLEAATNATEWLRDEIMAAIAVARANED